MNGFHNILVFYKTSVLQHCANQFKRLESGCINKAYLRRLKQSHASHYDTIKRVAGFLSRANVSFKEAVRGQRINFSTYDLVISIGGDGTLLEAARNIKDQLLFAINSDPQWSVGYLCSTSAMDIEKKLLSVLSGKFVIKTIHRLRLKLNEEQIPALILNDLLICHQNPAAMSRYFLAIGKRREEHKDSGIWISTAAGSTGAIRSAGGKIMPRQDKRYQYKPRELYSIGKKEHILKGGILSPGQNIHITSLMKEGMIYLDGCHKRIAFPIGYKACVSQAREVLNLVTLA